MSVVTPEIRFFADCHWLMADNIILLRTGREMAKCK